MVNKFIDILDWYIRRDMECWVSYKFIYFLDMLILFLFLGWLSLMNKVFLSLGIEGDIIFFVK